MQKALQAVQENTGLETNRLCRRDTTIDCGKIFLAYLLTHFLSGVGFQRNRDIRVEYTGTASSVHQPPPSCKAEAECLLSHGRTPCRILVRQGEKERESERERERGREKRDRESGQTNDATAK